MSSLQKFHRRTLVAGGGVKLIGSEAPVAGSGFYLGLAGDGTSYMYVAPKSTEVTGWQSCWGSVNINRNTTSTTDGVSNTNTLRAFGNTTASGHPAAFYCKNLSTGGYNTWYLPAKDELNTCAINRAAIPFATSDGFGTNYVWSSTESSSSNAWNYGFGGNGWNGYPKNRGSYTVRAVRRALV